MKRYSKSGYIPTHLFPIVHWFTRLLMFVGPLILLCFGSCSKENLDAVRSQIPSPFKYLAGIFGNNGVGAVVALNPEVMLLFNQAGDRYAWIEGDSVLDVRDISDPEGLFDGLEIASIGAGVSISAQSIYLFDHSGGQLIQANFNSKKIAGQWTNPAFFTFQSNSYPVDQWGREIQCPFAAIGAAWKYDAISDCSEYSKNAIRMVSTEGNEYVYFDTDRQRCNAQSITVNKYPLNSCEFADRKDQFYKISETAYLPLEEIDAASIYYTGGKAAGELFFTDGGKKFGFRAFQSTEFQGPFPIF